MLLTFGFLVITMKPAVIGVYGKSNAGKTSLIIKLIKRLVDEGYNVATIKNTDKKIGIDSKGKDTWKHSQSGAKVVVLSSPVETDFLVKEEKNINDIIRQIDLLGSYDAVLVEGSKDPNITKIRIGNIQKRENTIAQYQDNFEEIVKLIKERINENDVSNVGNVIVKVNGAAVSLSLFPSTFIRNTVVGMLRSLKGIDEIKEVELRFKC